MRSEKRKGANMTFFVVVVLGQTGTKKKGGEGWGLLLQESLSHSVLGKSVIGANWQVSLSPLCSGYRLISRETDGEQNYSDWKDRKKKGHHRYRSLYGSSIVGEWDGPGSISCFLTLHLTLHRLRSGNEKW